jgi:NAD(P)-dependent dehydrogenase (short-subunit alcohol dehydrogenase family)
MAIRYDRRAFGIIENGGGERAMSVLDGFRLDGKVAIVTGGAGGIGQIYGRGLADAGASVVLADLNAEGAEQAATALVSDGRAAIGVKVDITDPAAAAAMAQRAVDEFGGVDILVNNAALMAEIPFASALTFPVEWWDRVMRVNVRGALVCTQACAPIMLERGHGRIINQASGGAFIGGGVYSASKLALVSLTMTLATELGPKGVNVNAIAPGFVQDDAGLRALPEGAFRESLVSRVPGKKEAPPEDLLGALLLLASPAGDWINGQVLSVDGGWIMRP